jgi:hypothetical protein
VVTELARSVRGPVWLRSLTLGVQVLLAIGISLWAVWLVLQPVSGAPPSDPGVASGTRDLNVVLGVLGIAVAAAIVALTVLFKRTSRSGVLVFVDVIAAALVVAFTPGADEMPVPVIGLAILAAAAAGIAVVATLRTR